MEGPESTLLAETIATMDRVGSSEGKSGTEGH